jgi:hypothetical protein
MMLAACGSRAPEAGPLPSSDATTITPASSASATPVTPRPSPSPSNSLQPSPTPTRSSGTVRVVAEGDAGKTFELRVGDSIRVELGRDYEQPSARPGGVLERTSATGGYPTGAEMRATFRAVAAGSADVESSTDYACLHATPSCALPQQLWSVHVVVKG